MKLLAGCFTTAILALTFTGCGDDTDSVNANAPPPAADGRPAGFEEDMRKMEKDMANPLKPAKAGAAAK